MDDAEHGYVTVGDAERAEFQRVIDYAFRPEDGPPEDSDAEEADGNEADSPGERRALSADGSLLTVCLHYHFRARLRGEHRDVGGIGGVATPPEHRRRGLVGELLAASLAEYRDRGWEYAVLWPFEHGFYRQFGWGTVGRVARVECPPAELAPAQSARAGTFRRVGPGEYAALDAVRRRADAGVQLAVDRAESWWRGRVFGSESYAYLWEREGEPRAYLVYEFEDGPEGRVLDVAEHAAVDHEAYLNLLRFCHDHDSQVATVRLRERATADLLGLVADPGAVDYGVSAGPMLRVVDVLAALGALNYPEGVSTSLTLAVDDDLAPWNDDTFRLAVEDGRGTVERTDATPRVRTDVATLSQVLAGHHSVSKAHRFGVLEGEGDATDALADLFPPRPVFLRERF